MRYLEASQSFRCWRQRDCHGWRYLCNSALPARTCTCMHLCIVFVGQLAGHTGLYKDLIHSQDALSWECTSSPVIPASAATLSAGLLSALCCLSCMHDAWCEQPSPSVQCQLLFNLQMRPLMGRAAPPCPPPSPCCRLRPQQTAQPWGRLLWTS